MKDLEWVPATDAQAVTHAIELEDWPGASALGTPAVTPLVTVLKTSLGQPERTAQITRALAMITETGAAKALAAFCRDGDVASAAVRSLEALLKKSAAEISEEVLRDVITLNNVVQFQFTIRRNSSVLEVFSKSEAGEIVIRSGGGVHASVGALRGETAFFHLLNLQDGEFRLKPCAEPAEKTISRHWENLLMEAAQLRDEVAGESGDESVLQPTSNLLHAPVLKLTHGQWVTIPPKP